MEIIEINQIRDDVGLHWVCFSGDLAIRAVNICRVPASTGTWSYSCEQYRQNHLVHGAEILLKGTKHIN